VGGFLERRFELSKRDTTVAAEVRGGAVTFLTMSYIVFVQPAVLSQHAGMDFGAVMAATCLSAALATLLMGLLANYPIAQAPLMGENFFFAISVVAMAGVPWRTALGIVFLSGVLFLALSLARVRQAVMDAVPASLQAAIAGGIGIFVAFIGLTEGGIVAKHPAPAAFVQIGDLGSKVALTTLFGLAVTAVLVARRVRGGMLIGLAATAALGAGLGLVRPAGIVGPPPSLAPTLLQLDVVGALRHLDLVFIFLFMLLFDTVGTLLGVGQTAGLLVDGKLPRAEKALVSDAVGTVAGALLGTSTVSSYIESAAGVAEGARTGLANVVTAALFVLALFFSPLVAGIGGGVAQGGIYFYPVTAPIVILVGSFMMAPLARVAWDDLTEAIPAFLCLTVMPFTFNIAHGVAAGVVAHVLVKAGAGRSREVSWLMWLVAALVVVSYIALPRLRH
jgi:AGZA family xanthine/uracil permease-like MFS transporter